MGSIRLDVELFCPGRSDTRMEDLLMSLLAKGEVQSAGWRIVPEEAM